MSTKLFVGNLDFKVTENDLQDAFAAHGTVVEAKDDEVLVKVDESSNTKIRFARSAIHQVIEQPKA